MVISGFRRLLILSFFISSAVSLAQGTTYLALQATKEAEVTSFFPTVNTITGSSRSIGRFLITGNTYYTNRDYIKFDLNSIPSNAIILDAKLKLFQPSSAVGSSVDLGVARVKNAWSENGENGINKVTWAVQSAFDFDPPFGFVSSPSIGLMESESSVLTAQIQNMVAGNYVNNGWMIRLLNNETTNTANYRRTGSRQATTTSQRPVLSFSYYIPMKVTNAAINHESSVGTSDGSVSPTLSGGPGGTLTYKWFNSAGTQISSSTSSPNLSNVPFGWYGLQVTSSVAGSIPFYYAFLVGRNCSQVQISFNPGPDYIDDAVNYYSSSSDLPSATNGGSDPSIAAVDMLLWTTTIYFNSLFKSRLWIDPSLLISQSDLLLFGNNHTSTFRPNDASFQLVTGDWNENTVTYSSTPSYNNSIEVDMPSTTSANENRTIDMKEYFQYWQQNPSLNFGVFFKLDDYSGVRADQIYFSSDNTVIANRPKINFSVSFSNPTAPNYCDQMFAKLDRKLTGVKYKSYLNHFYFFYEEEYNSTLPSLKYNLFKANNQTTPVMSSTSNPLNSLVYGDNRYALNVTVLPIGVYILEIINDKDEKFYLRFEKTN